MKSEFSLIDSQDDPSDSQLSNLMSEVRLFAHNRVERVNRKLNESLIQAIKDKQKHSVLRAPRNA
jgi:hypothetical protein|nr:hypothetical protein [uncultured Pseudomonas sp.]